MAIKIKPILLLVFLWVTQAYARPRADTITTISLKAISGLQFDVVRFTVKPGARVKIVYTNIDDMSHNLLILKPGSRVEVVNAALKLEERGPEFNYIPKLDKVLWFIKALSPEQTKSVTFTAPAQAGVYPYACTYPGHGFVMFGAMYVNADGKMPELKTDLNVPPKRRDDKTPETAKMDMAGHDMHMDKPAPPPKPVEPHPYKLVAPYLYRAFMDDASPAAIAVCLPQNLSYCWDAGTCRLRYGWYGGFIDMAPIWKGHSDAMAKLIGTIFYREAAFPLQIGKSQDKPVIEYKGYRLINKYPEFHYTYNGTDVYELIMPKDDGNGLVRNFKIPDAKKIVWFTTNTDDTAVKYDATTGKWERGKLKLEPQQAREFSVSITSYPLVYTKKSK
jgi:plastocyanin